MLNNAPLARYIPDTTKGRIHKAAQHLGYRPNLFARSLRGRRSHTVGVMVFDMTDPYCTLVLRGIENTLYQSSYLPILTDVHNERSRFERYLEMLLDRRIEALIVRPVEAVDDLALEVRVKDLDLDAELLGIAANALVVFGERHRAEDVDLDLAAHVHAGAVDHQNFHGMGVS